LKFAVPNTLTRSYLRLAVAVPVATAVTIMTATTAAAAAAVISNKRIQTLMQQFRFVFVL
jgi:hypothetical protein